jgi:hypothetical protein
MAVSVHDNLLISYEVQCETRRIILRTEYRVKNEPTEFTNVIFKDVQGYHFENDAFRNIILGFETVPVEEFLAKYGPENGQETQPRDRTLTGRQVSAQLRGTCGSEGYRPLLYLRHTVWTAGFSRGKCPLSRPNRPFEWTRHPLKFRPTPEKSRFLNL